ncbi:MAG: PLP-dependent aminotransferase family protein [Gemmatimonadetes bacterium]|nr:PLP-dependent aminotransferase family protein [Gemmatimonadota bacterium]NNM06957.1 PLP-dependent aminotransferase family protein [Gemmatimonadota bacterium]
MPTDAFRLSRVGQNLQRSVMRDLLRFAVDPNVISLAGGLPASEHLPLDDLRECIDLVLSRDGPKALQYSPQHLPLRAWIAEYMGSKGVPCTAEEIFITNGNQHGLAILSRLFLDQGEPAVIEEVTFTGIHQVTVGREAEVRTLPTDLDSGVCVESFAEALKASPKPKFAVLITDFHNPLGVSIAEEKRAELAALAARYGVPLIEDDPYAPLRFRGGAIPPIKAHDEAGMVFYLGSFSKMLAPALRLGWIAAPADLMARITTLRESFDLESSTLFQRAVTEFVDRGLLEPHLQRISAAHGARRDTMLAALERHLSDVARWSKPEGGVFVWVSLPEGLETTEMFHRAIEKQVAYIPGGVFSVDGSTKNALRLNFSNVTPEAIDDGVQRLATVIRQALHE